MRAGVLDFIKNNVTYKYLLDCPIYALCAFEVL